MAHKDGQGRPIEQTVIGEIQSLPKDENGLVIISDNLSSVTKAYTGKGALEKVSVKSMFADAPVVNAFTNF